MMEGLLSYSRLNTMAKPFCDVSVARILEDLKIIMMSQISASGAQIEIGEMPTVHGDVDQLMLLFQALFDNAIKFQPADNKPLIRIAAKEKENCWQFYVADNGIGIDPKFHEKIFRLFGRLHADDEYPGVGIGLTLAQKIVERHGGNIWIDPLHKGTVFLFEIPKR